MASISLCDTIWHATIQMMRSLGSAMRFAYAIVCSPILLAAAICAARAAEINSKGFPDGAKSQLAPAVTLSTVVTPEQFGAVGNGKTDDTAALTACVRASATRGVACRLGARTYAVDDIALPSPVVLVGKGPAV